LRSKASVAHDPTEVDHASLGAMKFWSPLALLLQAAAESDDQSS